MSKMLKITFSADENSPCDPVPVGRVVILCQSTLDIRQSLGHLHCVRWRSEWACRTLGHLRQEHLCLQWSRYGFHGTPSISYDMCVRFCCVLCASPVWNQCPLCTHQMIASKTVKQYWTSFYSLKDTVLRVYTKDALTTVSRKQWEPVYQ